MDDKHRPEEVEDMRRPCMRRINVVCDDRRRCSLCGWNAAVERKRKQLLHRYGVNALSRRWT